MALVGLFCFIIMNMYEWVIVLLLENGYFTKELIGTDVDVWGSV